MGRIKLRPYKNPPLFRKVAMGTWKTAKDPSVYGLLEIDMQAVLDVLPAYEKKHDIKVTASHLVGKAIAFCMSKRPEINGMIRGSRLYLRDSVTAFYQVNVPGIKDEIGGATLSGATIEMMEYKFVSEIAKELKLKARRVKEDKDDDISKNMRIFKYLPWWLCSIYLNVSSWLVYGLNLNLKFLGIPKDPFGSVMITNVGSLGIDIGLAPLCPYTRVPLILLVGGIQKMPWIVDDEIQVRPILRVGVTFDHRFIDGIHASQMAKDFKKCFSHPEQYLLNN